MESDERLTPAAEADMRERLRMVDEGGTRSERSQLAATRLLLSEIDALRKERDEAWAAQDVAAEDMREQAARAASDGWSPAEIRSLALPVPSFTRERVADLRAALAESCSLAESLLGAIVSERGNDSDSDESALAIARLRGVLDGEP